MIAAIVVRMNTIKSAMAVMLVSGYLLLLFYISTSINWNKNILVNYFNPRETYGDLSDTVSSKTTMKDMLETLPDVHVNEVNCAHMFNGDKEEINKAKKIQEHMTVTRQDFINLTSNCRKFRESRGYLNSAISEEEEDFSIAFSVMMYKDPEQTERLLRAIYRPQNYYCIHIDRKADQDVRLAMVAIASCFLNVFICHKSVDIKWGEFSVLEAELACMITLWSKPRWRYLINLTGQEFPLKTNLDLVHILKIYNGANDVKGSISQRMRWRSDFVYEHMKVIRRKTEPPPHDIRLTKGSMKGAYSRDFVDFIMHHQVALDFLDWVKDIRVPEETFFSSLNHNPQLRIPGAFTGDPDSKPSLNRFVIWETDAGSVCHGKWVRRVCILSVDHLPELATSPELFLNKFHYEYHPLAYDCMEELHFNRTRMEMLGRQPRHLNLTLYQTMPFIKQQILGLSHKNTL